MNNELKILNEISLELQDDNACDSQYKPFIQAINV